MAGGWKTHLSCFVLLGVAVYTIVVLKDVKSGVTILGFAGVCEGISHKIQKAGEK